MASKYWIKLYHEILHDPKMGPLPDRLWRRFVELCLIAGEVDEEGILPSVEDMAWTLRLAPEELQADIDSLRDAGFVNLLDDGATWNVTKFGERQAPVPADERGRRYRDRQRKQIYYGSQTDDEQEPDEEQTGSERAANDAFVDTDTDTDTDTDQIPPGGASAHTPEEPEPPEPKPEEAEEKPARKPRARTAKEPKAPPPPAVEVYRAAMERYPAKTLWPGIVQVVGAEQASLDRWRKVLLAWLAMGWNKTNVKGPLGYFQRNEIPGDDGQTRGAVNHGAHRNSRRPASAEAIGKKTKSPEELRRELYPEKYGGSMPSLPGQGSATT